MQTFCRGMYILAPTSKPRSREVCVVSLQKIHDSGASSETTGDGDGTADCEKVDAIRCRRNALIHNTRPLPVASILGEIVLYDVAKAQDPYDLYGNPDFYYIDAGEPLDDPREALPYTRLNWVRNRYSNHAVWHGQKRRVLHVRGERACTTQHSGEALGRDWDRGNSHAGTRQTQDQTSLSQRFASKPNS